MDNDEGPESVGAPQGVPTVHTAHSLPAEGKYASATPQPFRPLPPERGLFRLMPLIGSLAHYRRAWGPRDAIAGIAVASLAVPQAMAYAQTAGLPVAFGLYGLLLPVLAYAFLGSSTSLMTGPTATAALLVGSAVLPLTTAQSSLYAPLAATLAILVGAFLAAAHFLRLGWMADYLSIAVLLGFLTGLGLTLIAGQLGAVTGVAVPSGTPVEQYGGFIQGLAGQVDPATLAVGGLSFAVLVVGGWVAPRFPTLLIVTLGAIAASWVFDLGELGVELVGSIPSGIPMPSMPRVPLSDALALIPAAFSIALVVYADAILKARSVAAASGRPVNADQELLALGAMNVVSGFSSSFPLGASGSRTALNARLGGRTQVASVVQVVAVALVLLTFSDALALLPKATLGAVIIYAAIGLIDLTRWRDLARGSRGELAIAIVTVVGMLTVGVLPALGIAVVLSVFDVARRSAEPYDAVLGWNTRTGQFVDIETHPRAHVIPGAIIYRIDDRLFFANSQYFRSRILEAIEGAPYDVTVFVFDASGVSNIDSSGAQELRNLIDEVEASGIAFATARLHAHVDDKLPGLGLAHTMPPERRFPTVRAAVLAMTGVDVESLPPPSAPTPKRPHRTTP